MDDIEIWEIYNVTEDAHPVHQHLVAFQILDRQKFKAKVGPNGALSNLRVIGKPKKPSEDEAGWKDTARMFPGEVTRVIATYDREGRYVWHCHILSHEDHEMMRPYCVGDLLNCE
jgi:spore coat protein A